MRWLALERHTVTSIVQIIEEHELQEVVDLTDGGRIDLLLTQAELVEAEANYEAAKMAGVNLDDVRWLKKSEVCATVLT